MVNVLQYYGVGLNKQQMTPFIVTSRLKHEIKFDSYYKLH